MFKKWRNTDKNSPLQVLKISCNGAYFFARGIILASQIWKNIVFVVFLFHRFYIQHELVKYGHCI